MDPRDAITAYYESIDAETYDRFEDVLARDFVQHRPDRTLDGRERYVEFMREERPLTDTSHVVDTVYRDEEGTEAAARGRLLDADGETLMEFVDVFRFEDGLVTALLTYTR